MHPPVAIADDSLFLEHVAPADHPERAERLLSVRRGLLSRGSLERPSRGSLGPQPQTREAELESGAAAYTHLPVVDATDEQLARVHSAEYVASLGHLAGQSGYLDSDTFLSPRSVAAARRAAGSGVVLVEAFASSQARLGFALPRPPGHHALSDRAMGFCLLNNVAVAAAHARARGYERVLVLDWDVHHGNGTEAMFWSDPSVLFVSLHQSPSYPGTGACSDQGGGEGRGSTVNLPLPKGGTDAVYAAAFERIVLPIVEQFRPTLALVSCGFDAHALDPLAETRLTASGYAGMTESLLAALAPDCPLGLMLEGGYDLEALEESSGAVAGVLLGERAGSSSVSGPRPSLSGEHEAALREIERVQKAAWKLG